MLEKTLENPLNCREMKSVSSKENQSRIFIGWTNAEAEAPILWPPDAKNWLLRKDSNAGKGWRQEKSSTEDEMVGWNHWLDWHEFEQAPGVWWWTGKPGVPQSMGLQRVDITVTQLNWTVKLYLDPMSCVLSSLACPLSLPEMLSLILSVWWNLLYPSRWKMGYKWYLLCKTFLNQPTQSVSFSSILVGTYLSCSSSQILLKVKYVYIVPFLCQMVCSST